MVFYIPRLMTTKVIFVCVNKACFIFLQAMGKALESTILSMVREIVFGVGFALLLPLKFGLDGVLYSIPLSDILTFLIAVFLIFQTYKELRGNEIKRDMSMNRVIAISREFGSGGRTIGRKDATKGCCVWLSGKGGTLNFVRRIIRNIC